jgi:hypothetical protein
VVDRPAAQRVDAITGNNEAVFSVKRNRARPQRYSHSWSQREQDDASQVLGSLAQRQRCTCSDSGEVALAAKTSHQRQCHQNEAGQAPRCVRGGHERNGTDDPIRELRFRHQNGQHGPVYGRPKERGKTMAKTYRDVAIEQMVATAEEAMSRVIDWWGDLPAPMKDAIEQFRIQLGAAIDSVEFVKRALDRQVPENDRPEGLA